MRRHRTARRLAVATAVLVASLAMGAFGPTGVPAEAAAGFDLGRISGADRYATAARVALATFTSADDAIVASGENFPDALAGNYLAGRRQAPILLARRDGLPAPTLDALRRLGVQRVTLLGGTGALGPAVASALTGAGIADDRIAGNDRFETAVAVARAGGAPAAHTAFLASGRGFADALAAGPLAYGSAVPQLLTEPGALPASVAGALADLGITHVVVLGGAGAVGPDVETALRAAGMIVGRVSGGDRYATSTAIADWAVATLGHRRDHVDLATGTAFPDALAGGVHTGTHRGLLLLAEPDPAAGGAVALWLRTNAATVAGGHVFGGVAAVAESVLDALVEAGRGLVVDLNLCETTLVSLANTERLLRGLAPLAVSPAAASIAESWAAHLAATQGLGHNPNLGDQLDAAGLHWSQWAENVGFSGSATEVHRLLVASPLHLANLVSSTLTHIGIGCVVDGQGLVWVTQVLYRL